MHSDLSPHLHTVECNNLISEMKQCFADNKYLKFLSVCEKVEIQVEQCLRKERLARQAKSNKEAARKNKELREIHRAQQQQQSS